MKRTAVIFLLLLLCRQSIAQHQPAGVMNMYTYGEKDGITHTNFAFTSFTSDGRFYTNPHSFSTLQIVGSNYSDLVSSPANVIKSVLELHTAKQNEIWIFQKYGIAVVKNNVIIKNIQYPANLTYRNSGESGGYFILQDANAYYLAFFDGAAINISCLKNIVSRDSEIGVFFTDENWYISSLFNATNTIHKIISLQSIQKKLQFRYLGNGPVKVVQLLNDSWIIQTQQSILHFNKFGNLVKSVHFTDKSHKKFTTDGRVLVNIDGSPKRIFNITASGLQSVGSFSCDGALMLFTNDTISGLGTYYACAGNSLSRIFPYIKKYPAVYNGTNSSGIFTLQQDSQNRIWAGSYNGGMSIIDRDHITPLPWPNLKFMNGGTVIGNKLYFFTEEAPKQLLQFEMNGSYKLIADSITGYYTHLSADSLNAYFGTYHYNGLWRTDLKSLQSGKPRWQKTDSAKGLTLQNIVTITEDTLGRIWCGQRGISIYYPQKNKATTWLQEKNETHLNIRSSLTDAKGTVWIGSINDGLYYYNKYDKEVSLNDIKKLNHPLLLGNEAILSMKVWSKWLVIGVGNRICLLDLDAWYGQGKTILRYLNPHELALTSPIEQNVFLIDKRDSSLWFSTLDNLYQLDMKKWLSLPTYRVQPNLVLKSKERDTTLSASEIMKIAPTNNSISLDVWFQAKDNMPRYMSTAFARTGDSILYEPPSLKNSFTFSNLASGDYIFYLKIFESDGTTSIYQYPISIKKFLWQQWWFWSALASLILLATIYFLNIRRKKQLAEEQAKTKEAELHSYRAEQEKKIADLKLTSLSSQFRPHFILNALNTIGAQMEKKPDTESVISRLGESVNLIFDHARQNNFAHQFMQEWKLVENVIHIHRLMYLKKLEVKLPPDEVLRTINQIEVPLGLIQIPIENALLHGVSNRLTSPWILQVEIIPEENLFKVVITDNGVGRKKAGELSNFTSHGTGLKNLNEIIGIINSNTKQKIKIYFEDDIYNDDSGKKFGTRTIIEIPG